MLISTPPAAEPRATHHPSGSPRGPSRCSVEILSNPKSRVTFSSVLYGTEEERKKKSVRRATTLELYQESQSVEGERPGRFTFVAGSSFFVGRSLAGLLLLLAGSFFVSFSEATEILTIKPGWSVLRGPASRPASPIHKSNNLSGPSAVF